MTVNFTTLRLRNKFNEDGGSWYAETVTKYHIKLLKEYRDSEPDAGWKLETRGYGTEWHIYQPNAQEFVESSNLA